MKVSPILAVILALISFALPACDKHKDEHEHEEQHKIVVTSPLAKDVIIPQQYVCQIHAQCHIEVRPMQSGYLTKIPIKEGQSVTKGTLLFQIVDTLYKAKLDAEVAEVQLAQLELNNTKRLQSDNVVSMKEVALYEAKLSRAKAKMALAEAEWKFTSVRAPFDGIVDRLHHQEGSLIKERDVLTTLSDNSVMWVYFNVPERRYLDYMAGSGIRKEGARIELADSQIELVLADGSKLKDDKGKPVSVNSVTVEGKFNNENGNIAFRADFPNPDRRLRHGMTGNVLILRKLRNALVIPQRATFEILDRRYVYVVGKDDVVHQREISVLHELDDIYVIDRGLALGDKFIYEGIRQENVKDNQKIPEHEFRPLEEILAHQKLHAE